MYQNNKMIKRSNKNSIITVTEIMKVTTLDY